ncbi:Transposase IS66 family protein [Adhaeretor mobilis]|uniref:Transposase IS66 family protein n=1 Tax=Adhaeretor mobilis TaxID=1930276 RepID=A0A517N1I2_9BACT|nr:Transposase IS66 family protein [Adhaeretor mobilis]
MLALVGQLYAIEREGKDTDNETRIALRQDRSVPILVQIKLWLDSEQEVVLPRSPMATAITYA